MTEELQCLGDYGQFDPPAFLQPYVDHFWYHTTIAHKRLPACFYRRVVPGAHVCIIFARHRDFFGAPLPGTLYFFGPVSSWRFVKIETGQELAAACLRSEWCEPVLGISPADHFDSYYPLRSIVGPMGEAVEASLQKSVTLDQVFLTLTTFLNEQIRCRRNQDFRRPLSVFQSLRETRGALPPSWIAYRHDLSEHYFRKFVADRSGLSPEMFSRIVRLRHALAACESQNRRNWQGVVNHCGFPDYDAMVEEIRSMTGAPPHTQQHEHWGALGFPTVPADAPVLAPAPAL